MSQSDLEARIIELETRISHLDMAMNDMSMMIKRQWDRIDVLERRNHLLSEDMKRMNSYMNTAPEDDVPPPHY
ncbi:SlyX family protein [Thalassospira profundimaris]|uniref:SlyX family protein n=1 Tax=Thalassospira profundimaris TaxID=502049 RepID=A0A367X3U4_9PROT|nr:SlyX family protein [Thalassospira profundimaris]RCK48346.1 SlyX family protein [Thalassospira profundimaris]